MNNPIVLFIITAVGIYFIYWGIKNLKHRDAAVNAGGNSGPPQSVRVFFFGVIPIIVGVAWVITGVIRLARIN